MKKTFGLLLSLIMLISCLPVTAFAAETWGGYTVEASKTTAEVGDTVDYTVYLDDCSGLAGGVWNIEFAVVLPEGMSYVSGKLNDEFTAKTGMISPDFNPDAMKVSALGALDAGYTGEKIAILTFSCTVEKTGSLTVGLTETVLSDQNSVSQTPNVTTATVTVTEKHSHSFGDWQSDADNHWKACACGEKSELAAHDWKWVTDKEATTAEAGSKHEECSVCDAKRNEGTEIPKVEEPHTHAFGDWESNETDHWKACACGEKTDVAAHTWSWIIDKEATTAEAGSKHEECSVCGAKRNEGTEIPKIVEEHKHSFGGWVSNADSHWKACACGEKAEVAAHTWNWIIDKEATTAEAGSKHEECSVCGAKRNEGTEIPKIEEAGHSHEYGNWQADENYHWAECDCGDVRKEAHIFGNWEEVDGKKVKTCYTCAYKVTESEAQSGQVSNPKTGDSSDIALWLSLLLVSALGVTGTVIYNRKKRA